MKTPAKIAFLVFAHLFLLNGLFNFRYPIDLYKIYNYQYDEGYFEGDIIDHIRLYFSRNDDEAYYYEWSTIVLGKEFEPEYPFEKRYQSPVRDYFRQTPKPHIPYLEIPLEYPPLAMAPILLAHLLSTDYLGYTRVFSLLVTLAYFLSLWLAYGLWKKIASKVKMPFATLLFLSAVSIACLGQVYVTRFDVFPSLLCMLALAFFTRGRYLWSAVWISAGFFMKAYPILLAPLFGLLLLHQKKYKEVAASALLLGILLVSANLLLGWATGGSYWNSFQYHASRGIQIESLYALYPYLAYLFLGKKIMIYPGHGSINIWTDGLQTLQNISRYLPVFLLSLFYGAFGWALWKRRGKPISLSVVVEAVLLIILVFMLSFQVLSPQFMIWLTPLIFLAEPPHPRAFFLTFLLLMLLTQFIFPGYYYLLWQERAEGILLLLARNLVLLLLLVWTLRSFWMKLKLPQSPYA